MAGISFNLSEFSDVLPCFAYLFIASDSGWVVWLLKLLLRRHHGSNTWKLLHSTDTNTRYSYTQSINLDPPSNPFGYFYNTVRYSTSCIMIIIMALGPFHTRA